MTLDALERRIGTVLKSGSALSTALLAVGLLLLFAAPHGMTGASLIQTGLVIVLATPIVRVLVSLVSFVQERDWKFVLMTLAVLGVLAGSIFAAFA